MILKKNPLHTLKLQTSQLCDADVEKQNTFFLRMETRP
jgi:hypothetical protein